MSAPGALQNQMTALVSCHGPQTIFSLRSHTPGAAPALSFTYTDGTTVSPSRLPPVHRTGRWARYGWTYARRCFISLLPGGEYN